LIKKDSRVPLSNIKNFYLLDNAYGGTIYIVEGSDTDPNKCTELFNFTVKGQPSETIEISYNIDHSGIVSVTGKTSTDSNSGSTKFELKRVIVKNTIPPIGKVEDLKGDIIFSKQDDIDIQVMSLNFAPVQVTDGNKIEKFVVYSAALGTKTKEFTCEEVMIYNKEGCICIPLKLDKVREISVKVCAKNEKFTGECSNSIILNNYDIRAEMPDDEFIKEFKDSFKQHWNTFSSYIKNPLTCGDFINHKKLSQSYLPTLIKYSVLKKYNIKMSSKRLKIYVEDIDKIKTVIKSLEDSNENEAECDIKLLNDCLNQE